MLEVEDCTLEEFENRRQIQSITHPSNLPEWLAMAASVAFHPLVLPTMAMGCIFYGHLMFTGNLETVRGSIMGLTAASTLGLPIAATMLARWSGLIDTYHMASRRERLVPMAMTAGIYAGVSYVLQRILPHDLGMLFYGLAGMAGLAFLITLVIKISAHTLAGASYAGFWLARAYATARPDLLAPLTACILLMGVLAWARLTLRAHTTTQVALGAGVGLVGGLLVGGVLLG